ncbi:MAG: aromatic ring-hydroxylating dioxygenase subunit alpha [Candidatus Melainabacteria bacterium]|nr:aromatic ring-hydroxylating dioxygenase subunit alpha [Candidatus Melainabacteria bacterium]
MITIPINNGPASTQKIHTPNLDKKINLFDPSSQLKAMPALWYTDRDIYEAERLSVFGQNWLAVGHTGEVANPLSYFSLEVADEPVVVLRDNDHKLKAFSNVCRHRATQLLTDGQGTLATNMMKCQYHGWCYDLAGHLRKAPELGPVAGFTREDHSLVPFEVESWDPLVFIRMQPEKESLQAILKPIAESIKDRNLSSLKWGGRKEYEVACNWKVYVDNYLDGGYHVPTVHPELAKALNYSEYRTDIFDRSSLQHAPTQTAGDAASAARQGSDAMYWWVYPNLMINIYQDVMDTNIVLPMGTDKCKVIFDFYFSDKWNQTTIDSYIASSHQVQLEDMKVCEQVQHGLKSQFYTSGPYAKRETGEKHFHELLANDLQRTP